MEKLISVCSIMKNESCNIQEFLQCYKKLADEIVIVDNGSEDDTANIAVENGCILLHSDDNFDLARNEYTKYASGKWILSVDADELMDEHGMKLLKQNLLRLKDDSIKSFIMPNNQYYGEGKWATWYLARLFRNDKNIQFDSAMHGSITKSVDTPLGYCNAIIHHMDGVMETNRRLYKRNRNISLIEKQIESEPERSSNYNYLAQELYAVGCVQEALTAAKQGYILDKDKHTYATIFYSQIAYAAGYHDLAYQLANEQKKISDWKIKENDKLSARFWGLKDLAHVILANIALQKGNREIAVDLCIKSIENMPYLAHNYINLYYLTHESDLLRKAVKLNPFLKIDAVYRPDIGPTIYRTQSSFLDCVINMKKEIAQFY